MNSQQLQNPKTITSLLNQYLKETNVNQSIDQLINDMLINATFLPVNGLSEQQKLEHRTIFTNITLGNNQNLGTILGMTVLGVIGFLALGFTFLGAIGGGALGIILGRYLGRKISKKIATKGINLTEFDIFVIRVQCLIKWAKIILLKYKANMNLQRFCVQRVLTEIKPLLHYKYFDPKFRKQSEHLLQKIREELSKEPALYALCVSYKLSKEYVQIIEQKIIYSNFSTQEISHVLQETVSDVLVPFLTLFENYHKCSKQSAVIQLLIKKIQKLRVNSTVLKCQDQYFDQSMSIEFIKMFAAKLSQKVKIEDLEKFLQFQNYRQSQQQQITDQDQPSKYRRKSQGDIVSFSDDVEQELNAQIPLIMQKQARNRAKSYDDKNNQNLQVPQSKQPSQICVNQPQSNSQSRIIIEHNEKRGSQLIQDHLIESNQLQQIIQFQMDHSQQQRSQVVKEPVQIDSDRNYQLSSELEEKFKTLVEIIFEPTDNWEIILKKDNLIIYKTYKPGNPACYVKGYGDLHGISLDVLLKAIHDEKYRQKWDKVLASFQVLERESPIVDIIYYYVQSPFGVSNREFCQKRILKYDYPKQGQIGLLYFSVDHKNVPKFKNHVRAETLISGYILDTIPGGSRLYFCSNNDVKGNIPKSLVNFVASRAPISWINSLRQGCQDHDKIIKELQKQEQQQSGKKK